MKISVVIPIYNAEEFLSEAIESVLHQTHQDLELVLVDDGSSDSSPKIMRNFAHIDKRVRIVTQENQGRCVAFNTGLREAAFEWVARLDADDLFLPTKLEKQIAFIQEHPDVRLLGTQGYHISKDGRRLSVMGTDGPFNRQEFDNYMRTNKPIFCIASSVLMHRQTVLDAGGLRTEVLQAEDIDLWNRVTEKGKLLLKIPEPLILYRVHESSISASKYVEQRMYYKWVRDCMVARRSGQIEPSLDDFLRKRKARPWYQRANSFRKDYGKYYYRIAALRYAEKSYFNAMIFWLASSMVHPEHAVPRVFVQKIKPIFTSKAKMNA